MKPAMPELDHAEFSLSLSLFRVSTSQQLVAKCSKKPMVAARSQNWTVHLAISSTFFPLAQVATSSILKVLIVGFSSIWIFCPCLYNLEAWLFLFYLHQWLFTFVFLFSFYCYRVCVLTREKDRERENARKHTAGVAWSHCSPRSSVSIQSGFGVCTHTHLLWCVFFKSPRLGFQLWSATWGGQPHGALCIAPHHCSMRSASAFAF